MGSNNYDDGGKGIPNAEDAVQIIQGRPGTSRPSELLPTVGSATYQPSGGTDPGVDKVEWNHRWTYRKGWTQWTHIADLTGLSGKRYSFQDFPIESEIIPFGILTKVLPYSEEWQKASGKLTGYGL